MIVSRSAAFRYGVAVLTVVAALISRLALNPVLGPHSPYLPFIFGVIIAARVGGRGPGLVATVLSAIAVMWFILEPVQSLAVADPGAAWGLLLFVTVASAVSVLVGALRKSLHAIASAEERLRDQTRLVNLSHDAIITADAGRRVTGWNAGAAEVYGWASEEALGKVIHDLLGTRNQLSTTEIDDVLLREGRWEGELIHWAQDGRRLWVESRQVLLRDDRGRPAGILEINRDITARKLAEEELRSANEQRRLALESANMGTWALDVGTGRVSWDERARALYGINADAVAVYPNTLELVHPDDRSRVQSAVTGALDPASTGGYQVEFRVVWPDGSVHWVSSKGAAWFEGTGAERHAVTLVGMLQDITERKRNEEALQESEERLRLAQQVARVGTFEWNVRTGRSRWTPELEAIYGLAPGGFTGRHDSWLEMVHPDDRAEVRRRLEEAMQDGRFEAEWRVICPDGTERWLAGRARVFRDERGEPLRVTGVNIDMTERKRSEEATRQALAQRTLALEAAKLGAWDYRFASGEVYWDTQCRAMLGLGGEERIAYSDALAVIHPQDRAGVDEATKLAISGINGGAFDRVYRVVLPNGSVRWISSHGRVFFEGEGEQPRPVRFVGVNMDVTDRRQSEDLLREGQKLESIGLLAGGVAHDFNNLLTVIIGNASTAPDGCTTRDQTEAILSAAERAAQLTRQLLAYAGKGYVIARVVDLTDLVARSRALLLTSVPRRVKLDFRLGERLPCIEADPSRIEQVLLNLVSNAGEAIPPGTDGLVEVSTGQLELTPELARQHSRTWEVAAGMYVWLEVRDNGAGMDESTLSRMFDPFFSTKFTGRGLGLAAVQGIVRSGKGFLDVKSMPEGGTSFRVYLPASAKQPAVKEVAPLEVKRGTATVLVVDDEDMVRKVACHMLRSHGYEVREAADGRQALGVLEGEAVLPAAVLLDLAMPVMGGEELIPILEQRYPEVKIVVSSGYPEEEARKGFPQRAVAGFLQKPYTASVLAAKMGEVLDEE